MGRSLVKAVKLIAALWVAILTITSLLAVRGLVGSLAHAVSSQAVRTRGAAHHELRALWCALTSVIFSGSTMLRSILFKFVEDLPLRDVIILRVEWNANRRHGEVSAIVSKLSRLLLVLVQEHGAHLSIVEVGEPALQEQYGLLEVTVEYDAPLTLDG